MLFFLEKHNWWKLLGRASYRIENPDIEIHSSYKALSWPWFKNVKLSENSSGRVKCFHWKWSNNLAAKKRKLNLVSCSSVPLDTFSLIVFNREWPGVFRITFHVFNFIIRTYFMPVIAFVFEIFFSFYYTSSFRYWIQ